MTIPNGASTVASRAARLGRGDPAVAAVCDLQCGVAEAVIEGVATAALGREMRLGSECGVADPVCIHDDQRLVDADHVVTARAPGWLH